MPGGAEVAICNKAWFWATRCVSEKMLGSETGRISLFAAKSRTRTSSPDWLSISSRYQWLRREIIAKDLAWLRCIRA